MSVIELNINISEIDSDRERVDYLTNALISLLRELDVDYIERPKNRAVPSGAKGDPITVGAIVLGIASAALPSLIALIQNWTSERRRVSIETPNGTKLEFTPDRKYSEDELLVLINKLSKVE